ncbi:MAG TPA: FTR1 family protein [Chloroflexota bacterium]|nr:FTR1 family protein [Chloroflexota bacterium]
MFRQDFRLGIFVLLASLLALLLVAPAFADSTSTPNHGNVSSAVMAMLQQVSQAKAALATGNLTGARQSGKALESTWHPIESTVAQQFPRSEAQVDQALDAANEGLATNPPAEDSAARLDLLEKALTVLSTDLAANPTSVAVPAATASVSDEIAHLAEVKAALASGNLAAARSGIRAFQQTWPLVESQVAAQSPSSYHDIESQMATVNSNLQSATPDLAMAGQTVEQMSTELQLVQNSSATHYMPFDAAITLFREGLEALLVIGALLALVTRAGRSDLRWQVWTGAAIGVVASLAVAFAMQMVFARVGAGINRELLEGVTGLFAAVMLLYVSYWMHGRSHLADWRRFLASRSGQALTSGSAFALPLLAFLAVFREGAETVLIFVGMAAGISLPDLILGITAGSLALLVFGIAFFRFGLRLSIRPFFRVISILLFYLGFKFVGVGIHSLQVTGLVPVTVATFLPSLDVLGLFPTWQTTLAQFVLILIAVVAATRVVAVQRRTAGSSEPAVES